MDTDSFFIYTETEDFYKDIAHDVERWFDTSKLNENDKKPLPIGKKSTRSFTKFQKSSRFF